MKDTAVALGTFDGLHIAHNAVLQTAATSGYNPVCLTFKTSPKFSISKNKGDMLLNFKTKQNLIKKMGFKVKTVNFNKIKNKSAQEFLDLLNKKYAPKVICCGYNFKFGKNALGDVNTLKDYFKDKAKVIICEKQEIDSVTVSSSQIRKYIKLGEIEKANKMLNNYFGFRAKVIKGDRRGRTIGFPTINQKYDETLVIPRFGAYITKSIIDKKEYDSITNVGVRPSFKTEGILVETHVLNYNKEIYGKKVTIKFVSFLRDETKFNSIEELKNQLEQDKQSLLRKEEDNV